MWFTCYRRVLSAMFPQSGKHVCGLRATSDLSAGRRAVSVDRKFMKIMNQINYNEDNELFDLLETPAMTSSRVRTLKTSLSLHPGR